MQILLKGPACSLTHVAGAQIAVFGVSGRRVSYDIERMWSANTATVIVVVVVTATTTMETTNVTKKRCSKRSFRCSFIRDDGICDEC